MVMPLKVGLTTICVDDDDPEDKVDIHTVYWAAYFGYIDLVKDAIEKRRMSPNLRCFKNRTIVTGAILGCKEEILRLILSYNYEAEDHEDKDRMKKMLLEKDVDGNTAMHHAYAKNQPDTRCLLREYVTDPMLERRMQEEINNSGESPYEMYHNVKFELTDDELAIEEQKT